jgi:hypothetical protein
LTGIRVGSVAIGGLLDLTAVAYSGAYSGK